MNCQACLRHASQCSDDGGESYGCVRDGALDLPNEDHFMFIDS